MSERFVLSSPYQPAGDQPQAIDKLSENFEAGVAANAILSMDAANTFTSRKEAWNGCRAIRVDYDATQGCMRGRLDLETQDLIGCR